MGFLLMDPLILLPLTNAGQYQCFASNEWGTATSNSVFVRKSDLNSFKDEPAMTVSAQEGSPFSLRCQPPDGWPKPSVYWMMQNTNGALRSINSSRMTVDPEGTLWFSNVTREDTSDDFVYACSATSLFRQVPFSLSFCPFAPHPFPPFFCTLILT